MSDNDFKTAQREPGSRSRSKEHHRSLLVLDGTAAAVHALPPQGSVTIGRGANTDVRINHASLSRLHAKVHCTGSHVTLEDARSMNGTFVGGTRLKPESPVLITPNSHIELGDVVVVLHNDAGAGVGGQRQGGPSVLTTSAGGREGGLDRLVVRVAQSDLAVLVVGESGVGKKELARRLHEQSSHLDEPFVVVRGAQLPDADFELENGTLVIAEIVDVPFGAQREILHRLESLPTAVRLVTTSSSANLEKAIQDRELRADLHQRINGITVVVPPLRARISEIAVLTQQIAAERAKAQGRTPPLFAPDAISALERHRWPGNVRELRTFIERAMVVCTGRVITASHIVGLERESEEGDDPKNMAPLYGVSASVGSPLGRPRRSGLREARDDAEYQRIVEALRSTRGNQTQAARMLGISRGTLVARLERYNMPRPRK